MTVREKARLESLKSAITDAVIEFEGVAGVGDVSDKGIRIYLETADAQKLVEEAYPDIPFEFEVQGEFLPIKKTPKDAENARKILRRRIKGMPGYAGCYGGIPDGEVHINIADESYRTTFEAIIRELEPQLNGVQVRININEVVPCEESES